MQSDKSPTVSEELGTLGNYGSDEERAEALLRVLEYFRQADRTDIPMDVIARIAHVSWRFAKIWLTCQGVHFCRGGWRGKRGWYLSSWDIKYRPSVYHPRLAKIFEERPV